MEEVQENEIVEEPQAPVELQVNPEVENRAKGMGWIPKEEFRGDPAKWRPAEEFVERAESLMPIMKTQMKKYEDKITSLESEVRTTKGTMEKIIKMSDKVSQREYDRAKSDLIKQQVQAVSEGDTEKWMQLENDKEKLEKPEPIPVEKPVQQAENPMFKTWHDQNDWYLNDPTLTRYANAIGAETTNPNMPYLDWLKSIETAVKEAFPHKFTNTNRQKATAVDNSEMRGGALVRPKGKSYNDLPQDAKGHCDKYISQGLFKTREDYVKSYFEEE